MSLAYNYLNKNSKQRVPVTGVIDGNWGYEHTVYLSCPLTSANQNLNEVELSLYKEQILSIKQALIELKFKDKDIYCSHFYDKRDSDSLFEYSRINVNKCTHFIAILPKFIGTAIVGTHFELIHRIARIRPTIVFYYPEMQFPAILSRFSNIAQKKVQKNVKFIPEHTEKIADHMREEGINLLDFNL